MSKNGVSSLTLVLALGLMSAIFISSADALKCNTCGAGGEGATACPSYAVADCDAAMKSCSQTRDKDGKVIMAKCAAEDKGPCVEGRCFCATDSCNGDDFMKPAGPGAAAGGDKADGGAHAGTGAPDAAGGDVMMSGVGKLQFTAGSFVVAFVAFSLGKL